MDGNELRPLQAPLKKRYREQFRWDSEFESGFLQRRVRCELDFLSRVDHAGEVGRTLRAGCTGRLDRHRQQASFSGRALWRDASLECR